MSKIFGEQLKYYRILAGLSQTDLANAAGTTRSSVNNYEHGFSDPNFETLCRLADALGIDITDLRTDDRPDMENPRRRLLSEDEMLLIDAWRAADPVYQGVAMDILRTHRRGDL